MLERYKHHINIDKFGYEGQNKLSKSKVLIIGAGGLGTFVASSLTSTGIGSIKIVDFDKIELSNLNRQIMYSEYDIGKTKVSVLANKLRLLNSQINIEDYNYHIQDSNCHKLIEDCDIICDCTDNLQSRMEIDNLCSKYQKPLVYSAVGGWEGRITVLHAKKGLSLNDIIQLSQYSKFEIVNCTNIGILSTTCAIAGSIQANEVIKLILDLEDILDGHLMCFNTLKNIFRTFKISKKEH